MEKVSQGATTNREQGTLCANSNGSESPKATTELEVWLPNPSGFKTLCLNLVVMTPTSLANLASKSAVLISLRSAQSLDCPHFGLTITCGGLDSVACAGLAIVS